MKSHKKGIRTEASNPTQSIHLFKMVEWIHLKLKLKTLIISDFREMVQRNFDGIIT